MKKKLGSNHATPSSTSQFAPSISKQVVPPGSNQVAPLSSHQVTPSAPKHVVSIAPMPKFQNQSPQHTHLKSSLSEAIASVEVIACPVIISRSFQQPVYSKSQVEDLLTTEEDLKLR